MNNILLSVVTVLVVDFEVLYIFLMYVYFTSNQTTWYIHVCGLYFLWCGERLSFDQVFFNWFVFNFSLFLLRSVKVMTAESPLTSVDFMSDGGTLAVGSTRGLLSTQMLITLTVSCK